MLSCKKMKGCNASYPFSHVLAISSIHSLWIFFIPAETCEGDSHVKLPPSMTCVAGVLNKRGKENFPENLGAQEHKGCAIKISPLPLTCLPCRLLTHVCRHIHRNNSLPLKKMLIHWILDRDLFNVQWISIAPKKLPVKIEGKCSILSLFSGDKNKGSTTMFEEVWVE